MPHSHDPHAGKPLRLIALGGAALVDASGAVIAQQRKRLALLSVIAAGRGNGVSRDKLVSYLSPERSSDSARHALQQLIYYLRQQAGDDALLGTDPLRLNPLVVTSDVMEFEDALDRGELDTAVAIYRGPFLDGFHIADSVEFENWAAGERSRLATRNTDALFRLAAAADDRGDDTASIRWWTTLASRDPLSGRAAEGLIRAYAAAGDVPAALRHASIYDTIVRAEFATGPDPALTSLVAELHAIARIPAPKLREPMMATVPIAVPVAPPVRRRWTRTIGPLLLAASAVVMLGVKWMQGDASKPATPDLVAVMPFRVTGADSTGSWLREGLVELLSLRLTDVGRPGPVDPQLAIESWRRAGGLTHRDPSLSAMYDAARRLGASHVVIGAVVSSGHDLLLSAELVELSTQRIIARVETRGRTDSVVRLIDTLAVRLVSIQGGEDMLRSGVLGATSVPAVRAYLDGRAEMQRGEWAAAIEDFERALSLDTTFASAALGLREASGYWNGLRSAYAESVAYRNQSRLSPRERSIFLAELGPNYPAWYPPADRLRAWRALAARDHYNADAWTRLGVAYLLLGPRLGIPDAVNEARIALEYAFELDSLHGAGSLQYLFDIAAFTGDSVLLERILKRVAVGNTDTATLAWHSWLRAFTRRDSMAIRASRPALKHVRNRDLGTLFNLTLRVGYDVSDATYTQDIVVNRARTFGEQASAAPMQYTLALNRGRPQTALAAAPRLLPEWRPLSRLALQALSALYLDGDSAAGVAAATALAREVTRPLARDAAELRSQMIHVCVSEQWSLAHGDTRSTDTALAKLRTPEPGANAAIAKFYETCAAAIEAWRAVLDHRPNSRMLAERLDSLLLTGTPWHWALSEHRVAARIWELLGEPSRALVAIRRRRLDVTGNLAGDLGEEGRLALQAGDTVGALRAWRHYLALRSDPEVGMRAHVDRIRGQVSVLTQPSHGSAER